MIPPPPTPPTPAESDPLSEAAIPRGARVTFRKSYRLRLPREFDAVYSARTRTFVGPLTVYARPNDLNHCRLGLSISRKVGKAVRRNRIRRLLREAFRLAQHDLPGAYDLVFVVRRHDPLALADYQRALAEAAARLHQTWRRRPAPGPTT